MISTICLIDWMSGNTAYSSKPSIHSSHLSSVIVAEMVRWELTEESCSLGDNWQASANVSPLAGNLHACYVQKISDQLTMAAELESSLRLQESTATIGYQVEIPNAHTTFRGQWWAWQNLGSWGCVFPGLAFLAKVARVAVFDKGVESLGIWW